MTDDHTGSTSPQTERAGVPLALDGAGTRVAVVDSGVDGSHPWFASCELSHMHLVKRGLSSIELEDAYQEDSPLRSIELDPGLSPRRNINPSMPSFFGSRLQTGMPKRPRDFVV